MKCSPRLLADYIPRHYDIAGPVELRQLADGANENYLVETPKRCYVLRVYKENAYYPRNSGAYRFELEFLRFLNERGIPAAPPVARLDGRLLSLLTEPSGAVRCAALFPFCRGENHAAWFPDFEAARVRRLGELIADLHREGDRFSSPYPRHHFDLHYLMEEPLRLLRQRLNEGGRGGVEFFEETAEAVSGLIAGLGNEQPIYGLIHADLHVGNILFDIEDGYCILDFDQCGFGWRAYDLATLLNSVAGTVPARADEIQRELLDGYQSRRRLTSSELDAIPTFTKAWTLWDIGETLALSSLWGGHRKDLTESGSEDEYLSEALDRLRALT